MLKSLLWITVVIASIGFMQPSAHADDAYICDGGRLVYARPETLEKLKQSDPCIQGYYAAIPAASAPATATPTPAATANPIPSAPLKDGAPQTAPGMTAKNKSPADKLAPLKGTTRDAALQAARPKPSQAKVPSAAPGTDFRNVRIINAPAADTAVYRHNQ